MLPSPFSNAYFPSTLKKSIDHGAVLCEADFLPYRDRWRTFEQEAVPNRPW